MVTPMAVLTDAQIAEADLTDWRKLGQGPVSLDRPTSGRNDPKRP